MYLEETVAVDQQVPWFNISVQNSSRVQVFQAWENERKKKKTYPLAKLNVHFCMVSNVTNQQRLHTTATELNTSKP